MSIVPRSLLLTGLRDLVRRPLQTGLMVLGVALGVAVVVAIGSVSVLLYHTIHQLQQVHRINALAGKIDLFNAAPLHAFAGLTARTGISLALSSPCGSADAEEEAGMAEEEYRWPP